MVTYPSLWVRESLLKRLSKSITWKMSLKKSWIRYMPIPKRFLLFVGCSGIYLFSPEIGGITGQFAMKTLSWSSFQGQSSMSWSKTMLPSYKRRGFPLLTKESMTTFVIFVDKKVIVSTNVLRSSTSPWTNIFFSWWRRETRGKIIIRSSPFGRERRLKLLGLMLGRCIPNTTNRTIGSSTRVKFGVMTSLRENSLSKINFWISCCTWSQLSTIIGLRLRKESQRRFSLNSTLMPGLHFSFIVLKALLKQSLRNAIFF